MKHTPGPWHIGMKPGPILYGPYGEQIADLRSPLLPAEETHANRRLLEAVPGLYQAVRDAAETLKRTLDTGEDTDGLYRLLDDLNALLARLEEK